MRTRIRSRYAFKAMVGLALAWLSLTGCAQDVEDIRVEGINQYRGRQYIESMATLRYSLSIQPSDAPSNYYMGMNYRALAAQKFRDGDIPAAERDLDTAILYFNQAVKSWPNYQAAIAGKTEALEARGKYLKALDNVDQVAYNTRGSSVEHYIYAANTYRDMGDFDSALRRYKLALAANPNSAKAYAGMGRMYELAGDQGKAMDAYRRAYELDPANPEANSALASMGILPAAPTPDTAVGPESGTPAAPESGTVTRNREQLPPPEPVRIP